MIEHRSDHTTADEKWASGGRKTDTWWHHLRFGRIQVAVRVHCHRNRDIGDRWVIQPELTYDRRAVNG